MKKKKLVRIVAILLIALLTLSSCSNKTTLGELKKNFDEIYLKVGTNIESYTLFLDETSTINAIKKLQSEENKKRVISLNKIATDFKSEITKLKSAKERAKNDMILDKLKLDCNRLVKLRDSYKKWDMLSKDEKMELEGMYTAIELHVVYLKKAK